MEILSINEVIAVLGFGFSVIGFLFGIFYQIKKNNENIKMLINVQADTNKQLMKLELDNVKNKADIKTIFKQIDDLKMKGGV